MNQEPTFLKAFDDYADDLYRHAYFRLPNRDQAEELTQEAYMRVWDYIRQGNHIESFRPFLYRTLNNLIINEYRRAKTVSLDEAIENDKIGETMDELSSEESAERMIDKLDADRIHELLDKIPEQYRTALIMRYINGMGVQEISVALQANENVISLRIHRGMKYLRKNFNF